MLWWRWTVGVRCRDVATARLKSRKSIVRPAVNVGCVRDLSARRFFQKLFDELADMPLKFKTVRTLRGLLTPGWLTAEYLAGRRQAYLTPLKVYLVCAAIFFLSAPVAGFRLASLIESDRSGTVGRLVSARVANDDPCRPLFNARFDVRVQSV